eukprot:scpid104412/ scgid31803/ 
MSSRQKSPESQVGDSGARVSQALQTAQRQRNVPSALYALPGPQQQVLVPPQQQAVVHPQQQAVVQPQQQVLVQPPQTVQVLQYQQLFDEYQKGIPYQQSLVQQLAQYEKSNLPRPSDLYLQLLAECQQILH